MLRLKAFFEGLPWDQTPLHSVPGHRKKQLCPPLPQPPLARAPGLLGQPSWRMTVASSNSPSHPVAPAQACPHRSTPPPCLFLFSVKGAERWDSKLATKQVSLLADALNDPGDPSGVPPLTLGRRSTCCLSLPISMDTALPRTFQLSPLPHSLIPIISLQSQEGALGAGW